ncbi:hypothetical protein MNBD_GAMMA15-1887 [hydrothermal vent metagenome]|uniref:Uncharacterized protein n=1 Tax=hydrothermal vent metagenome TaxID=652676 RepID=A0A3B0YV27_9ZZZZ
MLSLHVGFLMFRNLLIFALFVLAFWYGADYLPNWQSQTVEDAQLVVQLPELELIVPPPVAGPDRKYADISVHTTDELELLFDRVEASLKRPRGEGEAPLVSLVLHGPEVEFFTLKNYDRYQNIVDRAAKLAALGAVEISICQTRMRMLGIGSDEVPAFLRQVPFGPGEVDRLREQGYVAM